MADVTKLGKYVVTGPVNTGPEVSKLNKYVVLNLLAVSSASRRKVTVSVRIGEP